MSLPPGGPDFLLQALQQIIDGWNATVNNATGAPNGLPVLPAGLPWPGGGVPGVNTAYGNLQDTFNAFLPNRAFELLALARHVGWINPVALGVGAGETGYPGSGVQGTGDLPPP